jgi:hypothetical protein
MANKYIKNEFNIRSHKRNANQNDIEILSHPSQHDCHQENEQFLKKNKNKKTTRNAGEDVGERVELCLLKAKLCLVEQ